MARFQSAPVGAADPLTKQIVYVGQTGAALKDRWRVFDGAATGSGQHSHSGGKTYFELYRAPDPRLFVAAFAVGSLAEPFRRTFILYAERRLLWKFVRRWGELPRCNKQ